MRNYGYGSPAEPAAWDRETPATTAADDGTGDEARRERTSAGPPGETVRDELTREGAYLVPLRAFIGLGWLRACAEKLVDPNWRDGATLAAFLRGQIERDAVPFPFYEALIAHVFLPHAAALGLVVLLGQLLAGLGILVGGFTNAALLGGLFMNLNFLLAGTPTPSAFYVVIQLALLVGNAGGVLGLDARLARIVRTPLLTAQPPWWRSGSTDRRRSLMVVATLSMAAAAYALLHVRDWSPAGSVEDPAMILAVLGGLAAAWAAIAALRAGRPAPDRFRRGHGAGWLRGGRTAVAPARPLLVRAGLGRLRRGVRERLAGAVSASLPQARAHGRLSVTVAFGWSFAADAIEDAGIEAAAGAAADANRPGDDPGPTDARGEAWPPPAGSERSLAERRTV